MEFRGARFVTEPAGGSLIEDGTRTEVVQDNPQVALCHASEYFCC